MTVVNTHRDEMIESRAALDGNDHRLRSRVKVMLLLLLLTGDRGLRMNLNLNLGSRSVLSFRRLVRVSTARNGFHLFTCGRQVRQLLLLKLRPSWPSEIIRIFQLAASISTVYQSAS